LKGICASSWIITKNQFPIVFLLQVSVTHRDMAVSDVNSVASSCGSVLTHSGIMGLVFLTRETSESGD